jgi:hypothetical protein
MLLPCTNNNNMPSVLESINICNIRKNIKSEHISKYSSLLVIFVDTFQNTYLRTTEVL